MYKFSVIMPVYNKEKYIIDTLNSVINQTFTNFEIIVVDDGSNDLSLEKIKSLNIKKLKILKQKNLGVSRARNNGYKISNGEYLVFLDADDIWEYDFLENINFMINKYYGGIYSTNYKILKDKRRINNNAYIKGIKNNISIIDNYFYLCNRGDPLIWTSATAISRKIFEEFGGFNEYISRGEDKDLWARIALKYKIIYNKKVCSYYNRNDENSLTHKKIINLRWDFENIAYRYINDNSIDKKLEKEIKIYVEKRRINICNVLISDKNFYECNKMLRNRTFKDVLKLKIFKLRIKFLVKKYIKF